MRSHRDGWRFRFGPKQERDEARPTLLRLLTSSSLGLAPARGEDQGAINLPETCSVTRAVLPLRRGGAVRRPARLVHSVERAARHAGARLARQRAGVWRSFGTECRRFRLGRSLGRRRRGSIPLQLGAWVCPPLVQCRMSKAELSIRCGRSSPVARTEMARVNVGRIPRGTATPRARPSDIWIGAHGARNRSTVEHELALRPAISPQACMPPTARCATRREAWVTGFDRGAGAPSSTGVTPPGLVASSQSD